MSRLKEAADRFLTLRRIAVVGVSRNGREAANIIYRKLHDSGYDVYPVNPNASEVEGDVCYPDLGSIPGGVEGVVVVTRPDVTGEVVQRCGDLGIRHVWMHRAFGTGSVAQDAVDRCHELGIEVIAGGCPMMFCEPVDPGHKCLRWFLKLSRKLPRVA